MSSKAQIPKGWRQAPLGDVAEVVRGISWSREQESAFPVDGTMPVVRIGNVQRQGFKMEETLYIRGFAQDKRGPKTITPRTLLMVGSNGNRDRVGNVFLAKPEVYGHLLASFLIGITPVEEVTESYLSASLRSGSIQSLITESTAGSTGLKNLSLNWLRNLPILLPPLPEQRAIAAVLDSIDDAIERTEAVIGATGQLRDSLLHQLLARGVPGWHTEWKDAPGLGTIPAGWEVVRLGEVLKDGPTNGIYKPETEYGSGVCLIRIDDFMPGEFVNFGDFQRIRATAQEIRRYSVIEGDLVINRVNSLSHIGKSVLIPEVNEPTLFESNMMRLRFDSGIDPRFGAMVLLSDNTRRYFGARAKKAVQQASINQQDVSELPLPLPLLLEQQAIAGLLDRVDATIAEAKRERDGLQLLKESAADTLLTGRVRVERA